MTTAPISDLSRRRFLLGVSVTAIAAALPVAPLSDDALFYAGIGEFYNGFGYGRIRDVVNDLAQIEQFPFFQCPSCEADLAIGTHTAECRWASDQNESNSNA